MSKSAEAIIFDMDGLMIDSEGKQSVAIEKMLKEHGADPVYGTSGVVQIVGIRARDNIKHLKEQHNLAASIEDLHQRKDEIYGEMLSEGVSVMPGLVDLLADLDKRLVKKALASSSSPEDIKMVLNHLGLADYFEVVVSGHEVTHGKPAPDIFLAAAKRLELDPSRCLVLEDSGAGIAAAKAAGMKAVAVPSRYTRDHDFDAADLIATSLQELNWIRLESLLKTSS